MSFFCHTIFSASNADLLDFWGSHATNVKITTHLCKFRQNSVATWRGKALHHVIADLEPRIFYIDLDMPLRAHTLVKSVAIEHPCGYL